MRVYLRMCLCVGVHVCVCVYVDMHTDMTSYWLDANWIIFVQLYILPQLFA